MLNTTQQKQLIAEVTALLELRLSQLLSQEPVKSTPQNRLQTVEMLTIRECAQAIHGLKIHTIRQLIAQEKIPYIRAGGGKNGKILINKSSLFDYFENGGI